LTRSRQRGGVDAIEVWTIAIIEGWAEMSSLLLCMQGQWWAGIRVRRMEPSLKLRLILHVIKSVGAEVDRVAKEQSRLKDMRESDALGAFRQYANASLFVSLWLDLQLTPQQLPLRSRRERTTQSWTTLLCLL
jgi:hypothetical protein